MTVKSYAKVNIFLKIVALRGVYHEIQSRFMQVEDLFDTITFIKKERPSKSFVLKGKFGCPVEQNSIYKAYEALQNYSKNAFLENFFIEYEVHVEKNIPEFAGLGGGSSNAAAFLDLSNRVCNLRIKQDTLAQIGATIGADVPFFIYGYQSANVSGIGEIVEPFEEEALSLEIFTPNIQGDTQAVYQLFRQEHLDSLEENNKLAKKLTYTPSQEILSSYRAKELNDLLTPAIKLYPKLSQHLKEGWFFSGSGSSFFKEKGN